MKKMFTTPLDQVCGKGKIIDPTHYIYFQGEFLYVMNGQVAIKQNLSLYGFNDKDMRTLDGYCIHKDVFKIMKKKDIDVGINCINAKIIGEHKIRIHLWMREFADAKKRVINQINTAFDTFNMEKTDEIAINPDYISLVRKAFVTDSSGLTFRFNSKTGGVLVTPNKSDYKEHAIIAPLIVTGKYADRI